MQVCDLSFENTQRLLYLLPPTAFILSFFLSSNPLCPWLSFILSVSLAFSLSVRFYPSVQSAGWEHGLNLCNGNTGNPMGFKIFLTFLCNALAFEVAPLLTETWSLWFKGARFEMKHMFIKKIQLSKFRMWNIDALWCLIAVYACAQVLFSWNWTWGKWITSRHF